MEDKKVKDKTRVMAHSRRRRENDTFTDIAEALPIQENAKDLDKASILRVAIHFLKLREMVGENDQQQNGADGEETEATERDNDETEELLQPKVEVTDDEECPLDFKDPQSPEEAKTSLPNFAKDVLQALDGFMLVISSDGRILYTSETISSYLGLRQVDVIGIHIHDIIHPQDITELATIFKTQGKDTEQVFDRNDPLRRNFVVRMRCAFTPSVRSITRCSNFKPIYCSAFLKFGRTEKTRGQFQGVVTLCKLASVSRIKEMCVGAFFKTKHSLDLGYTGIDTRIRWILGYDPTEMMGHKAYQYFHPQDLNATSSCHMNLLSQGHSHSPCYRFMSRWGDWLWVRSKSYVTYNPISHLPDGLLIYTWIVRLDEEDDRMKAIQDGKSGDHLTKTYANLSSSISIEGGSLDISKLADPNTPSPANEVEEPVASVPTPPGKPTRPAMIQKQGSGYLSFPSPLYTSTIPSPPLTVTTPPESIAYTPQQSVNSFCGSPETQTAAGQTGFFGATPPGQQPNMPSPPYTPYDNSPPHTAQRFTDPCISGTTFQDYQVFPPNSMATSTGYLPQTTCQQPYSDGQYMQQNYQQTMAFSMSLFNGGSGNACYTAAGLNPASFEMQATVISASPSASTLCYHPPNLTDLQFPADMSSPSGNSMATTPNSAHSGSVDRKYISDARVRYNHVACPALGSMHRGKRLGAGIHETTPNSQWSSAQWLQTDVPPAPVY